MSTQEPSVPIASMLKRGEIKLLLVEDDKFLRDILSERLRREGYTVFEAVNGEEGMLRVRAEKPHLLLLDLVLPGAIDGYELLKQLKADPALASTPVVIVSNLGTSEDKERAKDLGAKDYLIKAHYTPQEITERIGHVLEESYLRR